MTAQPKKRYNPIQLHLDATGLYFTENQFVYC